MSQRILIAGLGRPMFGDDAVGLLVAEKLGEWFGNSAQVILDVGGGWDVLAAIESEDFLVLIDAAQANEKLSVGQLIRIDFNGDLDSIIEFKSSDTHSIGLKSWIEIARKIGKLPRHVTVYAIGGRNFLPETPLSNQILTSIDQIVHQIETDILNSEISLHN